MKDREQSARIERIPDAIQWQEGMLLAPQHFQELASRCERLVHYHASVISPFHWGVLHLKLDPVLLVGGTFRVLELAAVMPDGLLVSHTSGHEAALEVSLTEHAWEMQQAPSTIHLAVSHGGGGSEVAGEFARYRTVQGEPVRDVTSGQGEVRIPRLRPDPSLVVTAEPSGQTEENGRRRLPAEPPARFVSFPLAQVKYGNETFSLTDYIAPHLTVTSDSPLGRICEAMAERLRERAMLLSQKALAPALKAKVHQVDLPLLLEQKTLVSNLVAPLPLFEALLKSGSAHPFTLYQSLCALVGGVSGLGGGLVPPKLSAYDHNDVGPVYEEALSHIEKMLREAVLEAYNPIPFDYDKNVESYTVGFPLWFSGRQLVLGVRGRPGVSEKELIAWMGECVIASESHIPTLMASRMRGAEREFIEREEDLVPMHGTLLFRLDTNNIYMDGDILQIRNRTERGQARPSEIILYVKKSESKR